MKKSVLGILIGGLTLGAFSASASGLDALAKKSCQVEVERYDALIAKDKAIIAEATVVDQRNKQNFVYPNIRKAMQAFLEGLPKVEGLLSENTKRMASEYNNTLKAMYEASNYTNDVKETIRNQLSRTYRLQLISSLKQELASLGRGWENGNWVTFDPNMKGFSVYFAPTYLPEKGVITQAGTIKYNAQIDNFEEVRKDEMQMVTMNLEFRYDPFTKKTIGLPESFSDEDIDQMFQLGRKSQGDFQTGVYYYSKNKKDAAEKEIKLYEGIASYKAWTCPGDR